MAAQSRKRNFSESQSLCLQVGDKIKQFIISQESPVLWLLKCKAVMAKKSWIKTDGLNQAALSAITLVWHGCLLYGRVQNYVHFACKGASNYQWKSTVCKK